MPFLGEWRTASVVAYAQQHLQPLWKRCSRGEAHICEDTKASRQSYSIIPVPVLFCEEKH